ncbi:hypothetical protein Tco_1398221, partial [Tanacetum coccineum]
LDVGSVNIPYLLAHYLRRFAARRKNGALISEVIDMAELPDAAAGAPKVAEDAPIIDEGDQRLAGRHFSHSMGPFGGAHLQHSRDAPGRGLARPAPP